MTANDPKPEHEQRGIQSIEVGGQLLRALAHAGRPLPLKDLAAAAGMAAARAHPYLVSFGKLGLIEPTSVGRWSAWRVAATLPPSGPALLPYERAPSVWAYAARCAAESRSGK